MKYSIKGLFVILTIVMSFVLVQGVYARDTETLKTFTGTVTSVDETTRSISLELYPVVVDGETNVTIYHMGPSWYWEDVVEIRYPKEFDHLKIEAFYCNSIPGWVGISVCYLTNLEGGACSDDSIELRDDDTLKPLWNQNAKTTDLSDTAAEATGDGEPNDYSYYHDNDNDYNWKYEQPGPHGK